MFGLPMAELLSLVTQASQNQCSQNDHHRTGEDQAKNDFREARKLQQEAMKDLRHGDVRGARADFAAAASLDQAGASALQNNSGFGSSGFGLSSELGLLSMLV